MKQFLMQAHRTGSGDISWITDSEHDDKDLAILAARVLHRQFNRLVRVIDSDRGDVKFKMGSASLAVRCMKCQRRWAQTTRYNVRLCRTCDALVHGHQNGVDRDRETVAFQRARIAPLLAPPLTVYGTCGQRVRYEGGTFVVVWNGGPLDAVRPVR